MIVALWKKRQTSLALCALFAIATACGGGGDAGGEVPEDAGSTSPGTEDAGNGPPGANPCEPNPCEALGIEGKTNCIRKSSTEHDCVCTSFYEDDGEGGCKLRPAEPSGANLDEAADWSSESPTYNATIKILSSAGRPLPGAQMIYDGTTFEADSEGVVRLADQPALKARRYEVRADGYAPTAVDVSIAGAGVDVLRVELSRIELALEIPGDQGGSLKVDNAVVEFPGDAFVGSDGFSIRGGVRIEMSTLDTQIEGVHSGPELIGEDTSGNKTMLDSLGMVYVSIKDEDGEPVGLMPNRKATLKLTLPADTEAAAGDRLALRSYNEDEQTWLAEGECTVEEIPEARRQGDGRTLSCRGSVSHFSWWTITVPSRTICANSWYVIEHSQRYEVLRTLRLFWGCGDRGSLGTWCWVAAGDGIPRFTSESALGDGRVRSSRGPKIHVLPPSEEQPASACSAVALQSGSGSFFVKYEVWAEAIDHSEGGAKRWFVYETENIDVDPVADGLEPDEQDRLHTQAADICRDASLCEQIPVVVNIDDMFLFMGAQDRDGDGHGGMSGFDPWHPYRHVISADCDDSDPAAYPGAEEAPCAEKDMNCDGYVPKPPGSDQEPTSMTPDEWHRLCDTSECIAHHDEEPGNLHDEDCDGIILDADDDSYVPAAEAARLAEMGKDLPPGLQVGDCADDEPSANAGPEQVEIVRNQIDEDCDGIKIDADSDGYWRHEQVFSSLRDDRVESILRAVELLGEGHDCDDDDAAVHPDRPVTLENKAESSFAGFYPPGASGSRVRTEAFCANFHPETGLPLVSMRSLLKDVNCDGLYTDLDGDGWTVPGDHTLGAGRAFDCNDLDPRIAPSGEPGSVGIADCGPLPGEDMANQRECPVDAPAFIRDVQSERATEPACPLSPSGLPTQCARFVDQSTGEPTSDWGCVFADAKASNPPEPPAAAGRLFGACGNFGSILPPCSSGVCGGPLRFSADYVAELNRLFATSVDCQPDGTCDTRRIEPGEWLGMCFPRCDACWGKTCATENPCAIPKCNGATGECEELTAPANGIRCEDGKPCTSAEMCWDGECVEQVFVPRGTACLEAGLPGVCNNAGECLEDAGAQMMMEHYCEWSYWGVPSNPHLDDYCSSICGEADATGEMCPLDLCTCGTSICGDARVEGRELCDDGNQEPGDGCEPDCGMFSNVQCDPGSYHDGSQCQLCVPGTYQPYDTQPRCLECPAGHFSAEPGAAECAPCPAGTHQSETGQTGCVECGTGLYNTKPGREHCDQCPACGEHSFCSDGPRGDGSCVCNPGSREVDGECVLCPPGSVQDEVGQRECEACPAGMYAATEGATECLPCPPGAFSEATGGASCEPCAPGHFQPNAGASVCNACPIGTVQIEAGSAACVPCEPGHFMPNTASHHCYPCGPGTYQDRSGQGGCVICPPGWFQDETGATECKPCPVGTFSDMTGMTECRACPAGQWQPDIGGDRCEPCTPGTFRPESGEEGCQPNPSGSYQPESGSGDYELCPPGSFQPTVGQSSCEPCPAGTFQPTAGGVMCAHCPIGSFAPTSGSAACTHCPPGSFQAFTGSTACEPCPVGTFQDQVGTYQCVPCPPGTSQAMAGSPRCTACPEDTYQPVTGGVSCRGCPDCGSHGSCRDGSGDGTCHCDAGWAGEACDRCAQGYSGSDCSPD